MNDTRNICAMYVVLNTDSLQRIRIGCPHRQAEGWAELSVCPWASIKESKSTSLQ